MISNNRVKEYRRVKGISALELARRSKIAPSTVHNIENSKVVVYPGWRKRIAKALGTSQKILFPEEAMKDVTSGRE